jgi:hypothetical protein
LAIKLSFLPEVQATIPAIANDSSPGFVVREVLSVTERRAIIFTLVPIVVTSWAFGMYCTRNDAVQKCVPTAKIIAIFDFVSF